MQPLLPSDPDHVGNYRLLKRLGTGAMGSVYLGQSRSGRLLAIKVVRTDLAVDDEFRERFRREAAMARSLGGFWTAAVVDADPEADRPWLATEYVPGPTLHRAVTDHGPLPEPSVRTLAAGLAEALDAVHRAGLVHRDLKPANVLLGSDGPRVIDFGIARASAAKRMTATGIFLGTPGFFSPEQTSGGELGPASDVFSLGAVLTFAATGSAPFGEETTTALLYQVVHAEPDLSEVPAGLRPLITACLAKDPAARPTPGAVLDGSPVDGASNPGGGWLPPAIDALVREHTTQLPRTSEPTHPAPAQPASAQPAPAQAASAQPASPQPPPGRPAPAQPAPAQPEPSRGPGQQPPAASRQGIPPAPPPPQPAAPPPAAPPPSARPPAPAPPANGPVPGRPGDRRVAAPGGCARVALWGFVGLLVLFVGLVLLGMVLRGIS